MYYINDTTFSILNFLKIITMRSFDHTKYSTQDFSSDWHISWEKVHGVLENSHYFPIFHLDMIEGNIWRYLTEPYWLDYQESRKSPLFYCNTLETPYYTDILIRYFTWWWRVTIQSIQQRGFAQTGIFREKKWLYLL